MKTCPILSAFYKSVKIDEGEPVIVSESDVEKWILETCSEEIEEHRRRLCWSFEDPGLDLALEKLVDYYYNDSESVIDVAKWMEAKS